MRGNVSEATRGKERAGDGVTEVKGSNMQSKRATGMVITGGTSLEGVVFRDGSQRCTGWREAKNTVISGAQPSEGKRVAAPTSGYVSR